MLFSYLDASFPARVIWKQWANVMHSWNYLQRSCEKNQKHHAGDSRLDQSHHGHDHLKIQNETIKIYILRTMPGSPNIFSYSTKFKEREPLRKWAKKSLHLTVMKMFSDRNDTSCSQLEYKFVWNTIVCNCNLLLRD